MYFLRSEIDNQNFEVDQKVIDASALLKNIAELTDVTEPIQIKCSSKCLDIFIKVIENSNVKSLAYDLKKELFKKIEDENIVEIVKEMGILDSDVFFDFIADLILDRIDEMNMKEIQEYFDFEADFSENEKAHINGHLLDYILSIDTAELKFPFPDTDILTLKNKFYTPMNVLLQRIIARSDAEIAFYLSLINKTLKNENDKHPIKITCFLMDSYWDLEINCCHEDLDYLKFTIVTDKKDDEKYFEAIKARKLDVSFQTYVEYCTGGFNYLKPAFTQYLSMDFIIPGLPLEVNFRFRNEMLNYFDVQKCTIPSIIYILEKIRVDFKKFYQQLIAKDFTKAITIQASDDYTDRVIPRNSIFGFIKGSKRIKMFKKANATKFHKIVFKSCDYNFECLPAFKDFVFNYMEEDGIIISDQKLFEKNINNDGSKEHVYQVADVKERF